MGLVKYFVFKLANFVYGIRNLSHKISNKPLSTKAKFSYYILSIFSLVHNIKQSLSKGRSSVLGSVYLARPRSNNMFKKNVFQPKIDYTKRL